MDKIAGGYMAACAEIVRAFHCILNTLSSKSGEPQPENAGKPWTDEDDEALCRMYDAGSTKKEMCAYFKRSEGGIASRLVRLGKIPARDQFYGR